jgi:ADP-ribose pyrophosphatase YjhB (NUDIX family)
MKDNRLEVMRHCPQCGAAAMSITHLTATECGQCGFRLHFNPAAAVAGFVFDAEDRVLFVRRAKDPGKGLLSIPGGFVDSQETAEEAQRRETREEVGLELDAVEYLMSQPNIYPFRGVVYDTLDLFFVCRVQSFDKARALDEVAGLVILKPEEVNPDEIAFRSVRIALAHLLRSRASS